MDRGRRLQVVVGRRSSLTSYDQTRLLKLK
jgi:hypothetical protein